MHLLGGVKSAAELWILSWCRTGLTLQLDLSQHFGASFQDLDKGAQTCSRRGLMQAFAINRIQKTSLS